MNKKDYSRPADKSIVEKVIKSLEANGIQAVQVDSPEEAKAKALSYIPKGSEVSTSTSKTLEKTGIAAAINESGDYVSVRNQLNGLRDKASKEADKQRRILGATPEFVLGSVHAVTKDGRVLVASATGSQIGPYAYSAKHVIWVVGTQKIVKDMTEAMDRLETYTLPLEDQRLKDIHGAKAVSVIRKLLIINKEGTPDRVRIVFVNQNVGF